MMLDRPILITGTPRSGKSTVRGIMEGANEFLCVEEPLMLWAPASSNRPDDRCTEDDATPEVCRRIRHDCSTLLKRAGKQRYLDDLSYHALRIPFARAVMPEAKIIHVIRDPWDAFPEFLYGWVQQDTVTRAVRRRWSNLRIRGLGRTLVRFASNYVTSRIEGRRRTWGPEPPGLSRYRSRSPAELAAYQWAAMVELAMNDLEACPPRTWLEVRFDQLVSRPAEEVERIVAFCEPRDAEGVMRRGCRLIDPRHCYEYRVDPSPADWRAIDPIIAPVLERLGRRPVAHAV